MPSAKNDAEKGSADAPAQKGPTYRNVSGQVLNISIGGESRRVLAGDSIEVAPEHEKELTRYRTELHRVS